MTARFSLARTAGRLLGDVLRESLRQSERRRPSRSSVRRRPSTSRPDASRAGSDYPGDYAGTPTMSYAPKSDGRPDPGEIVWGWVPFEEDHSQGKDRPVLIVGRDGRWLLALMLTSKDHDRDAQQEHRAGRLWCDIGTGDWDDARAKCESTG